MAGMADCRHLDQLAEASVAPLSEGCGECLRTDGTWVHLRRCQTCGNVACCDQSPNRHATAHFKATRHPVIRSHEPGQTWTWCYPDSIEYDPATAWDDEGASLS
jgi:uncharacterized UBP type Zn finger protein